MIMIPLVILKLENEDDRAYMTDLYQRHYALMLKTAWTFTHERADVEDIVSDSCASLIGRLDTIRAMEGSLLRTYIVRTVRNTAIDHCRKKQRTNARFIQMADNDMELFDSGESVEGSIMLMDELETVRRALLTLPELERDVLRLKCQQGLRDPQIAELTGVSESTVRRCLKRAREKLKTMVYRGADE